MTASHLFTCSKNFVLKNRLYVSMVYYRIYVGFYMALIRCVKDVGMEECHTVPHDLKMQSSRFGKVKAAKINYVGRHRALITNLKSVWTEECQNRFQSVCSGLGKGWPELGACTHFRWNLQAIYKFQEVLKQGVAKTISKCLVFVLANVGYGLGHALISNGTCKKFVTVQAGLEKGLSKTIPRCLTLELANVASRAWGVDWFPMEPARNS